LTLDIIVYTSTGSSLFIAALLTVQESRPPYSPEIRHERYSFEHTEPVCFVYFKAVQQSRTNHTAFRQAVNLPSTAKIPYPSIQARTFVKAVYRGRSLN